MTSEPSSPPRFGAGAAFLEVMSVDGLVSVQDLGRPGQRAGTVPLSGAADQTSHRLVNRLVGNVEGAATLECTFASIRLRASAETVVAVGGPPCHVGVETSGRPSDRGGTAVALTLHRGEELVVGRPRSGLRTYVAVRGGVDAPLELGSRSWDSLAGLGPPPLTPGEKLGIGDLVDPGTVPLRDLGGTAIPPRTEIPLDPGPHLGLLDASTQRRFGSLTLTVGSRADRAGVQLAEIVAPGLTAGIASFPVLPGSVQIPPDGRPFVLGRDSGVTGGYPVVGVVPIHSLDLVGQLRPGDRFRFRARGW